jgi:hypothetical protein
VILGVVAVTAIVVVLMNVSGDGDDADSGTDPVTAEAPREFVGLVKDDPIRNALVFKVFGRASTGVWGARRSMIAVAGTFQRAERAGPLDCFLASGDAEFLVGGPEVRLDGVDRQVRRLRRLPRDAPPASSRSIASSRSLRLLAVVDCSSSSSLSPLANDVRNSTAGIADKRSSALVSAVSARSHQPIRSEYFASASW